MTAKEINQHFANRNFAPLQEQYKKQNNGQKFNEGCYSCLAVAQRVLLNMATPEEVKEEIKIEQPKPTNNGNSNNNRNKKRR
jgi:hypothetical protein